MAVRPGRVLVNGEAPSGGSYVHGTVADVVYLGMYTQLHVDTPAGRIVSHRLADEVSALEPGGKVTLSWEPDHAAAL